MPMKKIAFFVEGQTEQIFVNKLVREILGFGNSTIILKKVTGGTNSSKHEFIRSYNISRMPVFTVLIYDCGSDNRVKSEILENIESLRESGYSYVIGLRDLYPLPIEELTRLERGLNFLPKYLSDYKNIFDVIVTVHEIETWFLAESHNFIKLDRKLTGHFIEQRLGFDPGQVNPISRTHPSEDLDQIYRLIGKSYTKKHWQVEKLVNRLDFNRIRGELSRQIPALNELILQLEQFKGDELTEG